MKFNINENVKVKLTDYGKEILRNNNYHYFYPIKEGNEGWSKWQLWALMEELGSYCGLGKSLPFETEIEIIENKNE